MPCFFWRLRGFFAQRGGQSVSLRFSQTRVRVRVRVGVRDRDRVRFGCLELGLSLIHI